ncbi:DUF4142 domain-containing protein [Lentzea sp. CA-135723]|uniref:DUF4142 domain-containing protein n=1 Tax=Lentzea sp. CA-135723 TaxID=3239950 RepID=UPI003D916A3B
MNHLLSGYVDHDMGDSACKSRTRWLAAVGISLLMPFSTPGVAAAQHDKSSAPPPPLAITESLPAAPLGSGGKGDEVVETKWGPLGAGDRDFISKVRLAGLWELPAGQQAMQKSQNPKILEAGQHLIDGHTALDDMIRKGGQALGVELPNQPNSDQSGWLKELSDTQGEEYERTFVNRLRAAHGKVYGFAAQIRAGTKNELVRRMAAQTMNTVFDHITMLEKTGLVDFAALPSATVLGQSAPPPDTAVTTAEPQSLQRSSPEVSPTAGSRSTGTTSLLVVLGAIGAVAALWLWWQRRKPARRAASYGPSSFTDRGSSDRSSL